jgi:hypothetical protein
MLIGAVHDLGLARVQLQPTFTQPLLQLGSQALRLRLAVAMADDVVGIPLAYFSPSWTAFQAERGRNFSVIVDGVSA